MATTHLTPSVTRRTALAGAGALGLAFAARGLLATASDASPEAERLDTADHPLVGSWQWTNYPGKDRESISFAIFTDTGGYVETAGEAFFLGIGVWRATGARTAELVMRVGWTVNLYGAPFESPYVVTEECLVAHEPSFIRIMIEVDATGNHMTGRGMVEQEDNGAYVIAALPRTGEGDYWGRGDRLTLASGMTATPAS